MQKELKILYISSEIAPFVRCGNLADVAGALPRALKDLGHDIRLFIPKYGTINDRKYTIREVIRLKEIKVPLHSKTVLADVKSAFLPNSKVQVYFVENKDYFDRPQLYVNPETNQAWQDNAERFIFFCRSIFAILKKLHWQPDIIHCNDWQTALIPFYLKTLFYEEPFFNQIRTLISIHDLSSQGIFDENVVTLIGNPNDLFYSGSLIEYRGKVNFLKAGLSCADFINTMSKSYAMAIKISDESSYGLREIFRERSKELFGIANGVDYSIWDTEIDTLIPHNYSRKELTGKMRNKQNLVEPQGLKFNENIPVIGIILDLLDQSDLAIVDETIDDIVKMDVQYIILSKEDGKFQKLYKSFVKKYPEKIAFISNIDDPMIHKIVAGADIFLFPCRFEPCSSLHLSCLKYGTIPIVFASGVLLETIKNFDTELKKGYGFVFEEYSPRSLITTIKQALTIFDDKITWKKLVDRAMKQNFSWQTVAEDYNKLYYKLVP
jgi:starch synthase